MTPNYVLAIDQGTTSSRAIVFAHTGAIVSVGQKEHQQIFPQAGWVEHDPIEIWENTQAVIEEALDKAGLKGTDIAAVGITNQRETTVVWDRHTGQPVYNAIVWQDTRTDQIVRELAGEAGPDRFRDACGLSLSTYFAGPKIKWILDNVPGVRARAEAGDLLFGTTDSWVIWNLTGGSDATSERPAAHVTDVTNASRTMLMDLQTLAWRDDICQAMTVPPQMLPKIKSSSEVYGHVVFPEALAGAAIAGCLGDQQAATFGQACFEAGMAKNTYGTGCFMLMNTGTTPVRSENGLLTTVCYKLGDQPCVYALEGSIAVAGSLVQWVRDNLHLVESAPQIEDLAKTVPNNGGVYFVPAFSGLFAPYWRDDARATIVGMTRFNNAGHIARAVLEATAFQTREVLEAMRADSGVELTELRVDGGMIANQTLMQFQADILGVDVVAPQVAETTALGAAYAAGIAVGFWDGPADVTQNWTESKRWVPLEAKAEVDRNYRLWKKAVTRSFDWVDEDVRNAPVAG